MQSRPALKKLRLFWNNARICAYYFPSWNQVVLLYESHAHVLAYSIRPTLVFGSIRGAYAKCRRRGSSISRAVALVVRGWRF